MHWIRRIHLYSGLFMFPWVMLYGATALLFNHPRAFPDRAERSLNRQDFADTPLAQAINPALDAEQIVAELNVKFRSESSEESRFRLVEPNRAKYVRDTISVRARGPGQDHAILMDLPTGNAVISTTIQDDADQPPFAVRGLKVADSLSDKVKTALPAALTKLGLAADDAGIAVGTPLTFLIEADGRLWKASYNVQTGAVTGRPVDAPGDLSWRRFLTHLHQAHGYPSDSAFSRWIWALSVDGMFASMTFWGLSGLCMWWQLKAVRRMGAVVVFASLFVAGLLAWQMFGVLGGS